MPAAEEHLPEREGAGSQLETWRVVAGDAPLRRWRGQATAEAGPVLTSKKGSPSHQDFHGPALTEAADPA